MRNGMAKWTVLVACIFGCALSANAVLLELDDALGIVRNGMPSSPEYEVVYVNDLLSVSVADGWVKIGDEYYQRINDNPFDPMPTASLGGAFKDDTGNNTFVWDSSYDYLVAKYDGWRGGDYVWYVGDLVAGETYEVPTKAFTTTYKPEGYGLSHVSLYNPNGTIVPDGGMTVVLLGMALSAFGIFRRLR